MNTNSKINLAPIQPNRAARRAVRAKNKHASTPPSGYAGQDYEIRCGYGDNPEFVVGWANTRDGIAQLCQMVLLHPGMDNPQVIKLTPHEKNRRRSTPKP